MIDVLEAKDVYYNYYDGTPALQGLSLKIVEGRKIALVGPNGAGKSTLMLMFNGILRPTSGEIRYRGEPLSYDSPSLRGIRRKIGMVLQNPDDQIFAPTVYQDVAFGPVNLGFSREKVDRYVGYALAYVGLSGYERRPPHHLSGGEKKRVAIAGVLAMEPEVMILDEPSSNLDPASSEEIMDMLDELSCGGKTMIISTHDVELAYRWADEVLLMERGQLLYRGTPSEVFSDLDLLRRARMKYPLVMEIYRELAGRGVLNGERPPRSVLELTDLLDASMGHAPREGLGKVYICNVDHLDPARIKAFLDEDRARYVGAMGTSPKALAQKEGIELDFTYGVIDKCILKAVVGKSSLIMTSGGMAEHARRRIEAYGREDGVPLQVEMVS
jgi:cobalt/nickel transport system ATP-binding protein